MIILEFDLYRPILYVSDNETFSWAVMLFCCVLILRCDMLVSFCGYNFSILQVPVEAKVQLVTERNLAMCKSAPAELQDR